MSGTILDKSLLSNGLDPDKAVYYDVESPSIENRPIFYMPIGKMSLKIKKILSKVHSISKKRY
jgi:hypothetical protein